MTMVKRMDNIVLDCFLDVPRGTYIRPEEVLEELRKQNESSIDTALPWQVRGLLEKLHQAGILVFDRFTGSYKLKE